MHRDDPVRARLRRVDAFATNYRDIRGAHGLRNRLRALFSSSRHVIAGPDAAIGLLAGSVILPLAGEDPARIAVLAAELAVLSGAVLLIAAQLKLGIIADLLSRPVLIGYLNGASLVLIATQVGKIFGIKTQGEEFFPLISSVVERLSQTHWPSFALGIALILLFIVLVRYLPRIPGALVVSAVAVVVAIFLILRAMGSLWSVPSPPGVPTSRALCCTGRIWLRLRLRR